MKTVALGVVALGLAGSARAKPATSLSSPTPVIDVFGQRRERVEPERPGQSVTIRPEDPTRFETKEQFGRDSALAIPETGRIAAGGFALPRVRGQDLRLTEVWVEDFQLSDPFTGLPLVDELDLRAFGELALHQGVTPPELATVSPIGVVHYRLRPVTAPKLTLGTAYGKPFGSSIYALGEGLQRGAELFSVRAYARQHRTDGRYRYYDDLATPYAVGDDRTLTRTGNDRVSRAAMPAVRYAAGDGELRAMALWQASEGGIPARSSRAPSRARQAAGANFASLRWRQRLARDAAELSFTTGEDLRRSEDSDGRVLGAPGKHLLKVETRRLALRGELRRDVADVYLDLEGARARVKTRGDKGDLGALERLTQRAYAGAAVRLPGAFLLEAKAERRQLADRRTALGDAPLTSIDAPVARGGFRAQSASGGSLAVGLGEVPVAPYLQLGALDRPPTLLEEYGDGAGVRASPEIEAEKTRHLELGARLALAHGVSAQIAAFQDQAKDRIVLLPSLGQTVRAQNVGEARVRGATVSAGARRGTTEPYVGGTWLEALDRTLPERPRVLPGVATTQAALGLAQGIGPATVRWTSRYRGKIFRDARNEIESPAAWLHDLAVDAALPVQQHLLRLGLLATNLTDVTKAELAARGEHADRGVTGLSDYAGEPLPGRQLKLWLEAEL